MTKATIGQIIEIEAGRATITKVYGNIAVGELRSLPKVKRPAGMFFQKRIFQYPFTEYHKAKIEAARRESEPSHEIKNTELEILE